MLENLRDFIIIFLVFLFTAFWYCGLTSSAESLFDVTDPDSPFYPEIEEEEPTLPEYAVNEEGEVLIDNDTTLNEVLNPEENSNVYLGSVSGGDALPPGDAITYAEMESLVNEALADTRAVNLSLADAYLSSAIVDAFSRVVDSYPSHYKYVAYRNNAYDSNEGYLLIGSNAKVNGNHLEFPSGSQLCHYYRVQYTSGYQTYYNYKYDVSEIYDTYRIPFNSGQLIYTNMVSGYPTLSENTQGHIASIIIPVFIVAVCLFIIMRRKK